MGVMQRMLANAVVQSVVVVIVKLIGDSSLGVVVPLTASALRPHGPVLWVSLE